METGESQCSFKHRVKTANARRRFPVPTDRPCLIGLPPTRFQILGLPNKIQTVAALVLLGALCFCPRGAFAVLANAWHIPDNTSDLGFSMRNPESEIGTNTSVTVYTGLQKFNNSYGTANQTGGTVFYKQLSQATWSSVELQFYLNGGPNPNNQYWRASFRPAAPPTNEVIQYYLRLTFDGVNELTNTYLYAPSGRNDTGSITTSDQKTAEADPFTFRIRPARLNLTTNNAPAPAAPVVERPAASASPMWWILVALGVIIGLLAGLLLLFRRQTPVTTTALVTAPSTLPALPGPAREAVSSSADEWRQRAIAAEGVAAQQAQLLGEKVGPELTEFAKQALVQSLYTQRNNLMETQRRAQGVLQELEDRLSELHLPLQERIQAYEKRITELEKELDNRGGELRELTRATLLLVRQKLAKERASVGTRFS